MKNFKILFLIVSSFLISIGTHATYATPVDATLIVETSESEGLKLKELLETLNCSKTIFGAMCLQEWLLKPTTDIQLLNNRQAIIRDLVENQESRVSLTHALQKIGDTQDSSVAYFQKDDPLNTSAQHFYFPLPDFLKKSFKPLASIQNRLNNSSYALGSSMALTWTRSLYLFLQSICLARMGEDFALWQLGIKDDFDPGESLTKAFKGILDDHNLSLKEAKNYDKTYPAFSKIYRDGTLGDRIVAFSEWYNHTKSYEFFGLMKGERIAKTLAPNASSLEKLSWKVGGTVAALGVTAWDDFKIYSAAKNSYDSMSVSKEVAQKLYTRLTAMSECIKNIDTLYALVANNSTFDHCDARIVLDKFLTNKNSSAPMQNLISLLRAGFASKLPTWYPTGNMLLAHKLIPEVRDELKELLTAVGEIDAYVSIAHLYKKHQDTNNKICFVEFIENEMPQLDLQDVWVPLPIKLVDMSEVVTNTVQFGCAGKGTKMILTGPNGCGKSMLLKPIGQSVALGQGWTIAPASKARMTPFHGIHICFDCSEDGKAGMSTYMAVDSRMRELEAIIDTSTADQKQLILADEPWRGTTDSVAARKIYNFVKHTTTVPHCIVSVATHTEKPIHLAQETKNKVFNMHVTVKKGPNSKDFERTFKLADGPALWWFNDENMQLDFVDWLANFYRTKKLEA